MDFLGTLHLTIRSLSGLLSIIGNAIVIILVLKFDYLQTTQNAFVLCLAMSDFLYGFVIVPWKNLLNNVHQTNMSETAYAQWFAGCQTVTVFNVVAYYGDYLSIAAITLDRFLYIKYPFEYTQIMTRKRTGFVITGIVSVSFSLSIIFVFVPDKYSRGDACSVSSFIESEYFAAFDLPLLTITCTLMLYTFYIYHTMVRKTQSEISSAGGNSKIQNKVTKMMLTVVGVFLLSNTFWYTVYFITDGMNGLGIRILQNFSSWFWHVSKIHFLIELT